MITVDELVIGATKQWLYKLKATLRRTKDKYFFLIVEISCLTVKQTSVNDLFQFVRK